MARRTEGWRIRPLGKSKTYYVRFTQGGKRYEISTGSCDAGEAAKRAAEIYASTIKDGPPKPERLPRMPLDELVAEWITAISGTTHATNTAGLYELHMRAHLIPFFKTLDSVTVPLMADYQRDRLKSVTRATVRKERNTLSVFLKWCEEQKIIPSAPTFPKLPWRALGTRATTRKEAAIDITPQQAEKFLAALPEISKGKIRGSCRFPVRAFFVVLWETGLRPSTLQKLTAPRHYKRGATELNVTADVDKARFARTLPLTARARDALDSVVASRGAIFGRRDYRDYVSEAAKASGMPAGFSPYDLRHGRALQLTEASGNLPGVAFVLGHKRVSTTAIYVRATRRSADAVMAAVSPGEEGSGEYSGERPAEKENAPPVGSASESLDPAVVRRAGLEPARCYPLAPQRIEQHVIMRKTRNGSTAEHRRKPLSAESFGEVPQNEFASVTAMREGLKTILITDAVLSEWEGEDDG